MIEKTSSPGIEQSSDFSDENVYNQMDLTTTYFPTDRIDTILDSRISHDIYHHLKLLEKLLKSLMETDQLFVVSKALDSKTTLTLNVHGNYFVNFLKKFPFISLAGKVLSCRIEAFREVLQNLGGVEEFETLPAQHGYQQTMLSNSSFTPKCRAGFVLRAVLDLRQIGNSRQFKNRQANAQKRANEILSKMVAVIHNLFQVSSKLLVVRVDFEYRLDARVNLTMRLAKQDLRKFLNNVRHQSQFNELLGYIWVAEEGVGGGFHFHTFFFFNGNAAQRDIFLSIALGKYWGQVTEGRGIFHSCNANKGSYRFLGIGMVSHTDLETHAALYLALKYFGAVDKVQSVPGERAFGFSKPLTPTPRSAGGRPRTISGSSVFTQASEVDALKGDDA